MKFLKSLFHPRPADATDDEPSLDGTRNQNPPALSLVDLVREDFATYDRNPFEPGLWAVLVHRFGNWRMDIEPRLLRLPFSVTYGALYSAVKLSVGIDVPYSTRVGRRLRIWHHGGIVLSARSIGDDVHVRHNTTFGIVRRDREDDKPTIGNRVEVGTGAAILGDIRVGDDTVIGANAVVIRDCEAHSTQVGVPAKPLRPATRPAKTIHIVEGD
ncbi:MAG: transferase [Deltaproteobacteria bacterium]|nr:transferase [Deltaproteobacteria bacterium]